MKQFIAMLACRVVVAFALAAGLSGLSPALAWQNLVSGCHYPLSRLEPLELGLDPTVSDPIAPAYLTEPGQNSYAFAFPFASTDAVGIVLPRYDHYSISPVASTTADDNYDISGCWGPHGVLIFAQPGLYTFLALPAGSNTVLLGKALAVGTAPLAANPSCDAVDKQLQRGGAASYFPLTPTSGKDYSGLMMDSNFVPPFIEAAATLKSRNIKFQYIGGIGDITDNIKAVFAKSNGDNKDIKRITAGEIGHGSPNCWHNKKAFFGTDLTNGTPTGDLKALEAAAKGRVYRFDIFSCTTAFGSVDANGNPVANHVMTHIATSAINPDTGRFVEVRAVNVSIFPIPPSKKHPLGSFALKSSVKEAVDAQAAGTATTITCEGKAGNVKCTAKRVAIYP